MEERWRREMRERKGREGDIFAGWGGE